MFSAAFSLSAGESINGLRIISVIGKGGFGEVYQVQDVSGARFALKVLLRADAELSGIVRIRSLKNPAGVMEIHSAGKLPDGRIFYLMPLADNLAADDAVYIPATLANRLSISGRLPTAELLDIVLAALAACAELHRHRLIHGDIKPENILFIRNRAQLSDFSLVRETTPPTGKGVPGTPGFLPQEELFGGLNGDSPQLDLYAIGMLLYSAFNLRRPADYPAPGEAIDLAEYRIIRKLYNRALSPTPAFRYRDAESFIRAARRAKQKIEAGKANWFIRHRSALYALTGIALLGAASFGIFRSIQSHAQRFGVTRSGKVIDLDALNLADYSEEFSQLETELEERKWLRDLCQSRRLLAPDDPAFAFLVDRIDLLQKIQNLRHSTAALPPVGLPTDQAAMREIKRKLVLLIESVLTEVPYPIIRKFQQLMTPENFFTPAEFAFYRATSTSSENPQNHLRTYGGTELNRAKIKIEELSGFANIRDYRNAIENFRRLIPKN